MNKKCFVGLSGGVDSSVAAYLLKKEGYDVEGITAWFWPESECCSMKAIDGASELCHFLNIPFRKADVMKEFSKVVVDNFCAEYLDCRTPNPCARCNEYIKFGELWGQLKGLPPLGAAPTKPGNKVAVPLFATGHYARIKKEDGRYYLKKGIDKEKDQSYMLYGLSQEQLSRVIFPIGGLRKEEVRNIADKAKLPTSRNIESQDVCFVTDGKYPEFVKKHTGIKIKKGYFIDSAGKKLGEHRGIIYYTIGQRRGLGIASTEPYFVIGFNKDKNEVILGREKEVYGKKLVASEVNWVAFDKLSSSMKVNAKIRYNSPEAKALITPIDNGKVEVVFDKDQKAITPGQVAVFYEGDILLGGGVIAL